MSVGRIEKPRKRCLAVSQTHLPDLGLFSKNRPEVKTEPVEHDWRKGSSIGTEEMDMPHNSQTCHDPGPANCEGWLDAIRRAARQTSPQRGGASYAQVCEDPPLDDVEDGNMRHLQMKMVDVQTERDKHATAAYKLVQSLETAKLKYGRLLCESLKVQRALDAQKIIVRTDEEHLAKVTVLEQECRERIKLLESDMNQLAVGGRHNPNT